MNETENIQSAARDAGQNFIEWNLVVGPGHRTALEENLRNAGMRVSASTGVNCYGPEALRDQTCRHLFIYDPIAPRRTARAVESVGGVCSKLLIGGADYGWTPDIGHTMLEAWMPEHKAARDLRSAELSIA